jgi:hypothetical protein
MKFHTRFPHTSMKRIKESIELCLEVEKPTSNEFIGVQKVAINA